jgi:hypothetical protein
MGNGWATSAGEATRAEGARYARAPRVLWRRAPDRVLVRRAGAGPLELTGVAAFVWCSIEEPCTMRALERELVEAVAEPPHHDSRATLGTALDRLLDHGLICEVP